MRWTQKGGKEMSIAGTEQEIEALEAMLTGLILVGNPESDAPLRTSRFYPPNLDADPETSRHFPPKLPEFQTMVQASWGELAVASSRYSQERVDAFVKSHKDFEQGCISIYVHGLFGYGCDQLEQTRRVALIRDVGFEQMRSPRGEDGKYWEVWYLAGAWAAQGRLKNAKLETIINFVAREIMPGSLDLVRQHMALTVD